jgi:lactate racemase
VRITLASGHGAQSAELPDRWRVRLCALPDPPPRSGEAARVTDALDHPLDAPRVEHFVAPGDRVLVLVSDKTRLCRTDLVLPLILARVHAAGVPREHVTVLFATGTHARQSEAEQRAILGDAVFDAYRVVEHDARAEDGMVTVGRTRFGTDVRLHPLIGSCDRVIAVGTIVHHYFAGYGGGAKLFMPGIAAASTAACNHRRALTADGRLHPACREGNTRDNPVAMDIADSVRFLPPVWYCAALLDAEGRVTDAVCGDLRSAHDEGCRRIDRSFRVPVAAPADLVITSAGGHPKDVTFIQAHKALHRARTVTRTGGVVVLVAACADGIGNADFLRWFDHENDADLRAAAVQAYSMNAHTAVALREKTRACTVLCVSALPDAAVRRMGMLPAATLSEAVTQVETLLPGFAEALVIPHGSLALPTLSA